MIRIPFTPAFTYRLAEQLAELFRRYGTLWEEGAGSPSYRITPALCEEDDGSLTYSYRITPVNSLMASTEFVGEDLHVTDTLFPEAGGTVEPATRAVRSRAAS